MLMSIKGLRLVLVFPKKCGQKVIWDRWVKCKKFPESTNTKERVFLFAELTLFLKEKFTNALEELLNYYLVYNVM